MSIVRDAFNQTPLPEGEAAPPPEVAEFTVRLRLTHSTHARGMLAHSVAVALSRAAAKRELPVIGLVGGVKVVDHELGTEISIPSES